MKKLFLFLILVSLAAAGCNNAELNPVYQPPPDIPPRVKSCTEGGNTAITDCLRALQVAAETGDRYSVGQILLARAGDAPADAQRDILRAGLFLNNEPWVTEGMAPAFEDAGDFTVPRFEPIQGTLIFFDEAQTDSPEDDSIYAQTALERIDLRIPPYLHPLAGDGLASKIAAAGGAVAAAWSTGRDQPPFFVPAAPLFDRLLGAPIAGATDAADAAILTGHADWFFRQGRPEMAWDRLQRALRVLPESAPVCRTRGMMLMAGIMLSRNGALRNGSDLIAELERVCLNAEVPEEEELTQQYLAELLTLEIRGDEPLDASAPAAWRDETRRKAYLSRIESITDRLDGRRAALLGALARRTVHLASKREACEVDEEAPDEELDAIEADLASLGRVDVGLYRRAMVVVDSEGRPDRAAVLAWQTEFGQAENRWIQISALNSAIVHLGMARFAMTDPRAIRPLCQQYFDLLIARVEADNLPERNSRNAERIVGAQWVGMSCGESDRSGSLIDATLKMAGGEDDATFGILAASAEVGFQAIAMALSGYSMTRVTRLSSSYSDGMRRYGEQLGDGPANRVLSSYIDVLEGVPLALTGQTPALESRLRNAVEVWGEVASEPASGDSPALVKWSPAFRLSGLGLLATLQFLRQSPEADATLLELAQRVDGDLQRLLENTGNTEYSDGARRLVTATMAVITAVRSGEAGDWSSARDKVVAAVEDTGDEAGWWGVIFDGSRMVLWEALAFSARSSGKMEDYEAALAEADSLSFRFYDRLLAELGATGTGWELIRLTGPFYRVMLAVVTADQEGGDIGQDLLTAIKTEAGGLETQISEALLRLEREPVGESARMSLAILRTLNRVGSSQVIQGDHAAIAEYLSALDEIEVDTELSRAWVAVVLAVVAASTDRSASIYWERAADRFADSWQADMAVLPMLIEIALVSRDEDYEQAATLMDELMGDPRRAPACDQDQVIYSLLPNRARLYELTGKHRKAMESFRLYRDALSLGEFAGDMAIACQFVGSDAGAVVNISVSHKLGALLGGGGQEGSFQVGAGWASRSDEQQGDLMCSVSRMEARRHDLVARAMLAEAFYALRAGELPQAAFAMNDVTWNLRHVLYAAGLAEPEKQSALATARQQYTGEMAAWVIPLAVSHGLYNTATQLDAIHALGGYYPVSIGEDPPHWLAGLDLKEQAGLPNLVNLPEPEQADALLQLDLQPAQRFMLRLWLTERKGGADHKALLDELRQVEPPDAGPMMQVAWDATEARLRTHSGDLPSVDEIRSIIQRYAQLGLDSEALLFGQIIFAAYQESGDQQGALEVGDLLLTQLDTARIPLLYAEFLGLLINIWWSGGDLTSARQALEANIQYTSGAIDGWSELERRFLLLGILYQEGEIEQLRRELRETLVKIHRVDPAGSASYRLVVADLILELGTETQPDTNLMADRINGILEHWERAGDTKTDALLKQLRGALDDEQRRDELTKTFLAWLLLGEMH